MSLSIKVNTPSCVLSEGTHVGYEYITTHNNLGYRCGYVRIPKDHPWNGKDYNEIDASVHGGLIFSEQEQFDNDGSYWIGFDCAHSVDAQDPELIFAGVPIMQIFGNGIVRSQEYVEAECKDLCEQAAAAFNQSTL